MPSGPGAEFEHRQILASTKFHDILVEYLTDSVAVYVIEATGLKSMDSGGTSDPFCEVWMESRATARKTATQVTKTMIKVRIFSKVMATWHSIIMIYLVAEREMISMIMKYKYKTWMMMKISTCAMMLY